MTRKTMGFFERTGGFRLDSVLEMIPSRKEGIEPQSHKVHKARTAAEEKLCMSGV
jgi:hypothetical protein